MVKDIFCWLEVEVLHLQLHPLPAAAKSKFSIYTTVQGAAT